MPLFFITGTDTGVGKTVLAALLTRHLRARGIRVAGLKPVCSGGRSDARALLTAQRSGLALNEINPWHFRAPLAPPLAAAQEGRRLRLTSLTQHVRRIARRFELTLVEGAGGLLSPLADDGDNRDLLRRLRARPIVVVPNRLGAINQALLAHAALTGREQGRAVWVLIAPPRTGLVHRLNARVLRRRLGADQVIQFPFLRRGGRTPERDLPPSARRALRQLADRLRASRSR